MKKKFSILILILFASFVFAQDLEFPYQEFQELPPIICDAGFFSCLFFFFYLILRIILVLALALSTIFIAYAGILYITKGGGKAEDIRKIHKMLIWAVFGLVVAFFSYAFVQFLKIVLTNMIIEIPSEERSWFFSYFLNNFFVYAQIEEPTVPEYIYCGPIKLPSVLVEDSLSLNSWKTCFLYFSYRFLSFLYILALMLGIIFLSWAGILYITQPEKSKNIHQRLVFGIVGIVFAILSLTIVKIIETFFTTDIFFVQ